MRRFGKILCGFGSIELLSAVILLIVIEHLPPPGGMGGGLRGVGDLNTEGEIERQMQLFVYVFEGIVGLGMTGLSFLVIGGAAYGIALLKRSH
jgi:hypothetical protein